MLTAFQKMRANRERAEKRRRLEDEYREGREWAARALERSEDTAKRLREQSSAYMPPETFGVLREAREPVRRNRFMQWWQA